MRLYYEEKVLLGVFGSLFLGLAILIWVAVVGAEKEAAEWRKFSDAHNCKVVAHVTAGYKTSAKTGYLCDDGITYFR